MGAVVPLARTGRRGANDLPLADAQPSLDELISEGQQQQADYLRLRWQRDVALGIAAAVLVCFLVAMWWSLKRQRPANPQTPPTTLPQAVTSSAPTTSSQLETRADVAHAGVTQTVEAWAAAWSAQDVETYLSFYAAGFEVPEQASRQAWEAQRRERLLAPRLIAVTLDNLEVELTGSDTATARFVQTYVSPGYGDRVSKTLILAKEAGHWLILEERS